MQYAQLGRTGLQVSKLCLGTMNFGWSADEATSHQIMDAAFDAGINFLDTADVYSRWVEGNNGGVSESIIGNWLKTKNRRDVILATKTRGIMWDGPNGQGLSRHHIIHAVEDSLRRLQTDYIDLYQTHWIDTTTPLEETLYALDHLVQSGKVLYVGASNTPAWRLVHSLWISDVHKIVRYESLQPHYSLFNRNEFENEIGEACEAFHIGVIPYSPLAAGFLTGKYTRENRAQNVDTTRAESGLIKRLVDNDKAYDALDRVAIIANERGVPMAHVALAWLLDKPTVVSPIIGARTIEQLNELVGAPEVLLSVEEVHLLDDASQGF